MTEEEDEGIRRTEIMNGVLGCQGRVARWALWAIVKFRCHHLSGNSMVEARRQTCHDLSFMGLSANTASLIFIKF